MVELYLVLLGPGFSSSPVNIIACFFKVFSCYSALCCEWASSVNARLYTDTCCHVAQTCCTMMHDESILPNVQHDWCAVLCRRVKQNLCWLRLIFLLQIELRYRIVTCVIIIFPSSSIWGNLIQSEITAHACCMSLLFSWSCVAWENLACYFSLLPAEGTELKAQLQKATADT